MKRPSGDATTRPETDDRATAADDRRRPFLLVTVLLAAGALLMWLIALSAVEAQETVTMDNDAAMATVFEFDAEAAAWPTIDDRVMGGVSRSRMTLEDGFARFAGTLSYDQGGGFTSVRSAPRAFGLEGSAGLRLRVRGDGRTYDLRLRTDRSFDGVSYRARFATRDDGRWQVVELPFSDFEPVFRGRPVPRHPALHPGAVRTVGLLLADGPAGAFRLDIDWIRATPS